jgi:HlyD family secretion protein
VGAQLDEHPKHPSERSDSVLWLNREPRPAEPEPEARHLPPHTRVKEWFLRTGQGRSVGTTLILLVLLFLSAYLWQNRVSVLGFPAEEPKGEPPPVVSVISPGIHSVAARVTFTGAIAARYDIPITAEGEGGRITAVLVEAGDKVKRGQVLARVDQSVLRPQVARLVASLEEARAQAALSAAEFERAQGVSAAGALSKEEIERRRAASVTDEARVKVAAAQLAEAEARLGRSEVRAPEDGLVLTRTAEVGQNASPGGEPLFRLARGAEIEMRGQIAEQDLATLATNQTASVYVTGIPEPFTGTVRLLGSVIDPATRLGEIRISLPANPALRPGAFARGEVVVSRAQRAVLPQTAVLSDAEGTYVYVVNNEQKVERHAVTVGNTVPEGLVISSGLEGTERVITTAGGFLRPGEVVEAMSAPSLEATTAVAP